MPALPVVSHVAPAYAAEELTAKAEEMKSIARSLRELTAQLVRVHPDEDDEALLGTPRSSRTSSKKTPHLVTAALEESRDAGSRRVRHFATGRSTDSSSSSSRGGSLSDGDPDGFQREKWLAHVSSLVEGLHAAEEREVMTTMLEDYEGRSEERAIALEELRSLEKPKDYDGDYENLCDKVEILQFSLLRRVSAFTDTLSATIDAISERRRQATKRRLNKGFSFAGMKEYRAPGKLAPASPNSGADPSAARPQVGTPRGAREAQELLRTISSQQAEIAELEAKSVIASKKLSAHKATAAHMDAFRNNDKPDKAVAELPDEVKEVLNQCLARCIRRCSLLTFSEPGAEPDEEGEDKSLRELQEEVDNLNKKVKELEEATYAMHVSGVHHRARRLSIFAAKSNEPPGTGGTSPVGSTARKLAALKAEQQEAQQQERLKRLQRDHQRLETKTQTMEGERQLFLESIGRAHRVWKGSAGNKGLSQTGMSDEGELSSSNFFSRGRRGSTTSRGRRGSVFGSGRPRTAAAWARRNADLAEAAGGVAPSNLTEGEEVLKQQQLELQALQEQLRLMKQSQAGQAKTGAAPTSGKAPPMRNRRASAPPTPAFALPASAATAAAGAAASSTAQGAGAPTTGAGRSAGRRLSAPMPFSFGKAAPMLWPSPPATASSDVMRPLTTASAASALSAAASTPLSPEELQRLGVEHPELVSRLLAVQGEAAKLSDELEELPELEDVEDLQPAELQRLLAVLEAHQKSPRRISTEVEDAKRQIKGLHKSLRRRREEWQSLDEVLKSTALVMPSQGAAQQREAKLRRKPLRVTDPQEIFAAVRVELGSAEAAERGAGERVAARRSTLLSEPPL